jgi:dihydroorotase
MNRKSLLTACLGLLFAGCTMVPQLSAQAAAPPPPPKDYDLLLKGGHVIDAKNNIDAIRDVAIKDGKIAKVAVGIPADSAIKTVNVTGLYVVPGLIDLHTHVFWGLDPKDYDNGSWSLAPDGFTLRNGVTTIVDAGSSGWRNFPEFKKRVIDGSETRVLAMLNIVGAGMGNDGIEVNKDDMDGKLTGEMALKYPGIIVGIKSAHFTGPEWKPYEQGVIAGTIAHIPLMIDYGSRRIERPLYQLLEEKLRPGDIYTHMYGGGRGEQDSTTGGPGKGMWEGRQRGIYFDVGHGQSSFSFSVAVPLIKAGFVPDSISTDLHYESMNAGMKDLLTTGDKFIAMGLPLKEVIADMTWHPATEIQQTQLGNLSEGAIADIAVLNLRQGTFGLVDGAGMVMKAHVKMECELTVKNGKFVYDLNGRASDPWDQPPSPAARQSNKWTSLRMQGFGGNPRPIPQTPEGQARIAAQAQAVAAGGRQRPARWQPYDTDANGKSTVKANAKLAPAGAAKTATPKVPPPAATWATPPSASWPPAQQPQ